MGVRAMNMVPNPNCLCMSRSEDFKVAFLINYLKFIYMDHAVESRSNLWLVKVKICNRSNAKAFFP